MQQKKNHASSPFELEQHLKAIEEDLKRSIDSSSLKELFHRLKAAQDDYNHLQSKLHFSPPFLSGSEEKISSLFGKVMQVQIDYEVQVIVETAQALKPGDVLQAKNLEKKIKMLKKWHRPCREHLSKLAEAEQNISLAQGKKTRQKNFQKIAFLPEEAEHLLELASLVYHKNQKERNKTYLSLSKEAKDSFNYHLICLKTKAFEKEKSTIQALFASAFDLAGVKGAKYLSSKEIRDFFAEEKKILLED